jgi:hypothetical protein
MTATATPMATPNAAVTDSATAPRPLAPRRGELTDALALAALTLIGLVGFHSAYGGHGYLVAGGIGVAAGLALSYLGRRAGLPLLAVAAAAALVFLLTAGAVGEAGALSLTELHSVVSVVAAGWQQLLTTGRPVGSSGGLLVLPYLLGLLSGIAGHALARRTNTNLLPAVPPAVVVVLSILFGGVQPVAAELQGTGFAAVAIVWAAIREHRKVSGFVTGALRRPWRRIAAGVCVLAIAAAGATVAGPRLPGANAHQRVVLTVVPPFDVSQYPSPLSGFRAYTQDAPQEVSVYGKELFTTQGLAAGSLVSIAVMDTYDGYAWGVANAAASGGTFNGFQRVGTDLPGADLAGSAGLAATPATAAATARRATITIGPGYALPWLPDLLGTTQIRFTGAGGQAAGAALRFNVATGTGLIPDNGPQQGLSYTVTAAAPPAVSKGQLAAASPDGTPDPSLTYPPEIQAFATAHAATATTPLSKVAQLVSYLHDHGQYSNGGGSNSDVTPGHGAGRLTGFLDATPIIGDDEQYAASMALLANWVGVPARVSLDGTVEASGSVYGKDVRADVELDLAQYGWVTLPASWFSGASKVTTVKQKQTPPPQPVRAVPPQRTDAQPPSAANQGNAAAHAVPRNHANPPARALIPSVVGTLLRFAGIPLGAASAVGGLLLGAKAARRRRRRAHGPPAARAAAAWRELLDLGRDLGIDQPANATRREQAAHAEAGGLPRAIGVALAADAAVFGANAPDAQAAAAVWALADQARGAARSALPPLRRAWVAVNPASLLRSAI